VFVVKLLQVVVEQNPQVILDRLARTQGGGFEGVLSDWRSSWADWVIGLASVANVAIWIALLQAALQAFE
jgi:hypothetical protein